MPATHRAIVLEPAAAPDPCANCEARPLSVCSAIPDKDLARLAQFARPATVKPGRAFIQEGDPAHDFFNVTGGTALLCKLLPDGRRQVTGFASTGHFLGLAVSDTYAFSAEAIDEVRICRFSRPKLRELLADFPAMEQRLLEVAANELVAAQEQMLLLGRKTARERVASFLIAQSASAQPCGPRQLRLHLPMNRTDIADYLGVTVETVSRTLGRLKSERLIELPSASDVVILDCERLESVAAAEE